MKNINSFGLDANMWEELPDSTEIRIRLDKKDVYVISKTDANHVKVHADYGYGRQVFIPLDSFTIK